MKKNIIICLATIALLFSSCAKGYLDTAPTNQIGIGDALGSITALEMAMTGLHQNLAYSSPGYGSEQSLRGFAAFNNSIPDQLTLVTRQGVGDGHFNTYYNFTLHATASTSSASAGVAWFALFDFIRQINFIIGGLDAFTPAESEKAIHTKMLGQAYGLRAYMNHTLLVLYSGHYASDADAKVMQGIPIRINTISENMARSNQFASYEAVLADIEKSLTFFGGSTQGGAEYFNANAVKMLKARVLMYTKKYLEAKKVALDLISSSGRTLMGTTVYKAGFNTVDNPEWIFGGRIKDGNKFGSFYSFWAHNYERNSTKRNAQAIPLSYVVGITDEDIAREGADFVGGLSNTVGLTIRSTDSRYSMILLDEAETISENKDADSDYYVKTGQVGSAALFVAPGMIRKFTAGETAEGDVVFMRLAEAYYIASEAAYELNDIEDAQKYLTDVVKPYDPTFTTTETGTRFITQLSNYKIVDFFGEGRSLEDVKRRGTWVYRLEKWHPLLTQNTKQYKSVAPYSPKPLAFPDMLTFSLPQTVLDSDELLDQYVAKK